MKFDPDTVTEVVTGPLFGESVIERVVTVKVAEPEFVATSVAVTAGAPEEAGTLNVAEKVPVPEVVMEAGFVVNVFPPNVTVTAEFGVKFEPVMVTGLPTGPVAGDNDNVGTLTVKVADEECVAASVAVTVLAPPEEEGTLNEQVNDPEVSVCTKAGVVITVGTPKVNVMVEEAAKPWPDAETIVPISPLTGFRANEVLTVNVAKAEFPNPSVTTIGWPPKVEAGTMKDVPAGIVPELVEVGVAIVTPL